MLTFKYSNITMDFGESLIIHSPLRVDLAVAVKVEPDGTLVVLLSPPALDRDRIEIRIAGKELGDKAMMVSEDIAAALKQASILSPIEETESDAPDPPKAGEAHPAIGGRVEPSAQKEGI